MEAIKVNPFGRSPRVAAAEPANSEIPATDGVSFPAAMAAPAVAETWDYLRDAWQRSILFLDALRERGDNMLEHEREGLPPLLDFNHETLLDGRRLPRPANYALLQVTEVDGERACDCVDPDKPPVMIVDPRAGHGPGIGGFKRDSEVGVALRAGHSVYFVIFFPEPVAGQTLDDVQHMLRRFVEEVARRHDDRQPILYGNCQAGWALTLLAADCHGLAGPVVLNGSPLSYWAGESGVNPMRVAGGLLGGAWLTRFVADLGAGRFDGAWLAQNFENLQPEKSIWEKHARLFNDIDTERERFLEFERWWNGFYFLSREEILAIVENLFIGNRLERGEYRVCDGCFANLRRIHNPIVVFASYGDNITPPHQALGWIPAVYKDTDDLKRAGQRIVYLTNPHIGHLGIFVSAKVARFEHRAILEGLDEIQALEPGLYEMKIDNPTGDPDCHSSRYSRRFEARQVEDLAFTPDTEAFKRVRDVSETNESVYRAFVSPWVRAMANPWSAEAMKWVHPMRTSRYLMSGAFNPWMRGLAVLANAVAQDRRPLRDDHPLMCQEKARIEEISMAIELSRKLRDAGYEAMFSAVYAN